MLVIEQCSWTVNAYVCIVQYPLCVLKLIVDRTLCRIILSIIVLVINKLHSHFAVVKFFLWLVWLQTELKLSPVRPILIQCVNYIARCFPSFFPLFSYFDWRRAYKGNLLSQDLVTHGKKNLLWNDSKKSYECTSWSAVRHNPKSHEEFSESSASGNVLNFIMLIASTMSIMSSTIHIYHIVTLFACHLWKTFELIFKSWVQSNELWASLVQNHL